MKIDERKQRQNKLANLFFEMGMDLDLVEKISGVSKRDILLRKLNNVDNTYINKENYIYKSMR